MNANPKIIVLKTREIIYTLLLLFLVVLLVICLVLMFGGKKNTSDSAGNSIPAQNETSGTQAGQSTDTSRNSSTQERLLADDSQETALYTAGVYTTPVTLGESTVDVEVTVDSNHINSIRLVNLSEVTSAAFPLVSPSLEHIASQILETQTLEGITAPQENRYTSQLLLSAVAEALEQARIAD